MRQDLKNKFTLIERANIGNPTADHPYGVWGYLINGEKLTEVPAGLGEVVISFNVGHGRDFAHGIEELRQLLKTHALRPGYAEYTVDPISCTSLTAIWPDYPGIVRFSGNFEDYSFAFSFDTNCPEFIAEFAGLMDANKATPAYAEAVAAHAESERKKAEWEQQKEAARLEERKAQFETMRKEFAR